LKKPREIGAISVLIVLLAVLMLQTPQVQSANVSATEKLQAFLSDVVGLDLAKYSSIPPGSGSVSFPSEFRGLVEQEVIGCKLESIEGKMDTMSIFYNGQMVFFNIYPLGGDYVYSDSPPTDIINQTKIIIQKYQKFAAQEYATDGSYLEPVKNFLSSINNTSPMDITNGNINFQITNNGDSTRIQWIYTENGVSMERKRVELTFRYNSIVSFVDTLNLYKVAGLSVISSEEAVQIALEAAKNSELHVVISGRNETIAVKPYVTDAPYDVSFSMVPGLSLNDNIPRKTPQDPLTLYPYWQVHFYFEEEIGGDEGMQVGVWGDTKEIVYSGGFGFLGEGESSTATSPSPSQRVSPTPSPTPSIPPSSSPTQQPTSEPSQSASPTILAPIFSGNPPDLTIFYMIVSITFLAITLAVAVALVYFRKHKK
jgi:hypothetical protein